jgi:hypothetical protein
MPLFLRKSKKRATRRVKRKLDNPEYREQKKIALYLKTAHPKVIFLCSIAGIRLPHPFGVILTRILNALGYRKGMPDIYILQPVWIDIEQKIIKHCGLVIELKLPDATASDVKPYQRETITALKLLGYCTYAVPGANAAIYLIENYLKGKI